MKSAAWVVDEEGGTGPRLRSWQGEGRVPVRAPLMPSHLARIELSAPVPDHPDLPELADLALRRRELRVIALLAAIILFSLGDLIATVTHLRGLGMIEANPVAAHIIQLSGSALPLTLYKAFTVAVCVGVLYRLRHHVQSEVGAWFGLTVLVTLMLYWGHYATHIVDLPNYVDDIAELRYHGWLTLAD